MKFSDTMISRKKKKKASNAKANSKKKARGKSARISTKAKSKSNKPTNKKRTNTIARKSVSKSRRKTRAKLSGKRIVQRSSKRADVKEKRRGKNVYDVFLKPGAKTQSEIIDVIDKIKPFRELPDNRVKLTFVARFRSKMSSISYNYDVDEPGHINESLKEILHSIFTKPVRGTTKSIKRMNRLKNYINRIILDFDSATNEL